MIASFAHALTQSAIPRFRALFAIERLAHANKECEKARPADGIPPERERKPLPKAELTPGEQNTFPAFRCAGLFWVLEMVFRGRERFSP